MHTYDGDFKLVIFVGDIENRVIFLVKSMQAHFFSFPQLINDRSTRLYNKTCFLKEYNKSKK